MIEYQATYAKNRLEYSALMDKNDKDKTVPKFCKVRNDKTLSMSSH